MTDRLPDVHAVDVLVIGSGAGGLLAALVAADRGADTLVIEKEPLWGGTSATSGGGIWIPGSDPAKAAGFTDDLDAAFTYVRGLSADNVPDANIRAYVEEAAPMLRWMMAHTPLDYHAFPYPDYHAERPGGSPTGFRTHMPLPIDGRLLGGEVATMRPASPAASLFGRINWHFDETYTYLFRAPGWWRKLGHSIARYWLDLPFRLRSAKDRRLTLGNALVGGLRLALDERRVPIWLESPMQDLIVEDGRVAGAVVRHAGRTVAVRAKRAVILAAGGFEQSAEMRRTHTPSQTEARLSGGQTGNTGDAIRAGITLGAATRNMHSMWSAPVFYVPGEDRGRLSTIERALPGCIIVNQQGRRYLNEAASYHIVGQQMAAAAARAEGSDPSWFVFDHRYRHKYPVGPLLPLVPDWLQKRGVRKILHKASTIEGLARAIGVPEATLRATIDRFNGFARDGHDQDFGRGDAAYDKMYGDPANTPNPTLRAIETGPFYAFPIHPGDIGTNGGLVTDERARVLADNGRPIAGLYAIGNTAASPMGESYPGAGVTLGPALTFGYIAARDALGANA